MFIPSFCQPLTLPRHLSCLDLPLWLSLSFPYLFLAGHLHITAALKSLPSKRLDGAGEGMTALLQYCHVSRRSRSDCTCPSREPGQLSLSGASLHVKALRLQNCSLFKSWSVTFSSEDLSTQILLKYLKLHFYLINIGKWKCLFLWLIIYLFFLWKHLRFICFWVYVYLMDCSHLYKLKWEL